MTSGWTATSVHCRLESATAEPFDHPALREAFVGGRGYGVALAGLYGSPGSTALDPAQPFVLAAGPLTGTLAPSSGRFAAVAPSPLTGTIFDSNGGGRFGVRLRQSGLDALVLTGAAPEWVVVVVDGRRKESARPMPRVRSVPLATLWPDVDPRSAGLTSSRTIEGLRTALGPGFSIVFPSVAGRRGSLLGSLRTDDRRTLGRGGMGAALAAKRVFAVAVAGDREMPLGDSDRFGFLVYEAQKQLDANPVTSRALPQFGTAVLLQLVNQAGALPTRNYRYSSWDRADAVSGERLTEEVVTGRRGCFGCRIRCTPRVGSGSTATEGPEYETLWALGADLEIDDLAAIQEANVLCGELGLDTVSVGATVACAMELGEEGVLARRLGFGDAGRLRELIPQMALREGFGAELSDGAARFAARYDRPDAAMHVKGLELPGYDPRGMHGQGLAYATSNRGACHLRGNMLGPEILGIPKLIDRFADRGKSGILINLQHLAAVFDALCTCKFTGFAFGEELLARLLSAATGVEYSAQDLLRTGERIWTLERLWNLAAGFTRADDTLPSRLLREGGAERFHDEIVPDAAAVEAAASPGGRAARSAGPPVGLLPMLDEYYRARGWDAEGVPRLAKVEALGLTDLAGAMMGSAASAGRVRATQGWRTLDTEDSGAEPGASAEREGRHLRAV